MTEDINIQNMKIKLNSAKRRKLINDKKEFLLRAEERSLTEQIAILTSDSESIMLQTEDLKQKIIQNTYQIAMIDICAASEKAKFEQHNNNITRRKESFDQLFAEEIQEHNARNVKLRTKIAEAEEAERKKQAKILEIKTKEATAIEEECVAIENECSVLVKRNKAIMIQLRRKLFEAESIRKELIKKSMEAVTDNI